jgi:flagellar hook-length control protein FliK
VESDSVESGGESSVRAIADVEEATKPEGKDVGTRSDASASHSAEAHEGDGLAERPKLSVGGSFTAMDSVANIDEANVVTAASQPANDSQSIDPSVRVDASAVEAPQPAGPGDTAPISRASAALERLSAERSLPSLASTNDNSVGDRARFVGRVEGAIRAAQQRDGHVHVRLSPPELGSLRIELSFSQGVLIARLEAETTTARNLLLDNLPALRDRLAQQDVRVERFDVDVRRDTGNGGSGHQGAHDRSARESDWRQAHERQERHARAQSAPARGVGTFGGAASDAALDVRV